MYEPIPIQLAVEDELSETVVRTMLRQSGREYSLGPCYGRRGYGYLKKNIKGFNNAAKGIPFIVLTDHDNAECAPALMGEWLRVPKDHNLIFRIAVKEVEAWVLAHQVAFASFLGISPKDIPEKPDRLADPKNELIHLARRSRRTTLRRAIVPRHGSKIGPDYNATLGRFVESDWDANQAKEHSPSRKRALKAIADFKPILARKGSINDCE
ncbi:hypothetical protein J7M28_09155 [bacterium]|nr:hypothetical protein [bacterium]